MTEPVTHQVNVNEGAQTEDTAAPAILLERTEYEVVNPIFKRGVDYEPGDSIFLDAKTAESFLLAGDIEELPDPQVEQYNPNTEESA